MAALRATIQRLAPRMASRAGFSAFSILTNCLDRSLASCCCLRKINAHGLPSLSGCFLLRQSRHVTIALPLFFARMFCAIPSYNLPPCLVWTFPGGDCVKGSFLRHGLTRHSAKCYKSTFCVRLCWGPAGAALPRFAAADGLGASAGIPGPAGEYRSEVPVPSRGGRLLKSGKAIPRR